MCALRYCIKLEAENWFILAKNLSLSVPFKKYGVLQRDNHGCGQFEIAIY